MDYSDNAQFGAGSLTFTGASADESSFTAENTGVVCFTSGTAIRTPDGDVMIDELRVGEEIRDSVAARLKELSALQDQSERTLEPLSSEKGLRDAGRDVRVMAQAAPSPLVENALEEFQRRWGVIHGRHSFLLPSIAVYRIGNGGPNGIKHPNMEMWLPVSPKRVLVLTRDTYKNIPMVVEIDRKKTREINEYAVRNSASLASHSQKLLSSLLNVR